MQSKGQLLRVALEFDTGRKYEGISVDDVVVALRLADGSGQGGHVAGGAGEQKERQQMSTMIVTKGNKEFRVQEVLSKAVLPPSFPNIRQGLENSSNRTLHHRTCWLVSFCFCCNFCFTLYQGRNMWKSLAYFALVFCRMPQSPHKTLEFLLFVDHSTGNRNR